MLIFNGYFVAFTREVWRCRKRVTLRFELKNWGKPLMLSLQTSDICHANAPLELFKYLSLYLCLSVSLCVSLGLSGSLCISMLSVSLCIYKSSI
jgi:hypothetical protein